MNRAYLWRKPLRVTIPFEKSRLNLCMPFEEKS